MRISFGSLYGQSFADLKLTPPMQYNFPFGKSIVTHDSLQFPSHLFQGSYPGRSIFCRISLPASWLCSVLTVACPNSLFPCGSNSSSLPSCNLTTFNYLPSKNLIWPSCMHLWFGFLNTNFIC